MDKETLSQYGWVIIVVIVLAIMIVLATPFGDYIKSAIVEIVNSFGDSVDAELPGGSVGDFTGETTAPVGP